MVDGQSSALESSEIRCPTKIQNGKILSPCDRKPFSECDFTCAAGCEPYVEASLYCNSKGTWTLGHKACRCEGSDPEFVTESNSYGISIGVSVGVIFILSVLVIVLIVYLRRNRSSLHHAGPYPGRLVQEPVSTNQSMYYGNTTTQTTTNLNPSRIPQETTNTFDYHHPESYRREPQQAESKPFTPVLENNEFNDSGSAAPPEPPPSYDDVTSHPSKFHL